jgi:hypothetical protein
MINVFNGKLTLRVDDELVTFDDKNSMSHPASQDDTLYFIDSVMTSVGTFLEEMCGTKHEESQLLVHQEEPHTSPRINELLVNQAPIEVVVEEIHMLKETK